MFGWLATKYENSMKPKRPVRLPKRPEYYYFQRGRITEVHRCRDGLLYMSLTDIDDTLEAVARASHLSLAQLEKGSF
jgi:hypothetical protein